MYIAGLKVGGTFSFASESKRGKGCKIMHETLQGERIETLHDIVCTHSADLKRKNINPAVTHFIRTDNDNVIAELLSLFHV